MIKKIVVFILGVIPLMILFAAIAVYSLFTALFDDNIWEKI